jgi:tetratricopeptide (TPR) repeat protein
MSAKDAKSSQSAAVYGALNIVVQIEGDGNSITVGRPHLTLIPPRNRAREIRTEIDLLNAYCRSIALVGRDADMQSLWEWLHSNRPVAVRTLKGRAGAGKTRIAIELIERLNTEKAGQWWAGFVGGREMRRFAAQQNLSDWGWARPTLVVVDYAASLIEPLREWLRDLAQNPARNGGRPLRLLLLEREAAAGEGWLQVLCSGGQSELNVPDLFDPLEPKRLDQLDKLEKRRAVLSKMLIESAKLVKCSPPKLPAPGKNARFDQQLQNDEWTDPLYLMMAALLSLRSDLVEVLQLPRTELATRLVEHEIKRLIEGVPRDAERLPVHLTAFAALGGGLTHELALKVAEEESTALKLNYPGGVGALTNHVHEVLPAPDHGIAPIIPDILAEALVLKAMKECSAAQQEDAILRAVKNLGQRVIPFMVRTVQDFAPSGEIAPLSWLERLIKAGKTDDLGLLMEIANAMPRETLVLREKAAEVEQLISERLGKLAQENPGEEILAIRGISSNNLSVRLRDLGRREEALAKSQEAVRIYGQLAQARPDAFLPDLAMSLNNLATALGDLGRREEALAKAEEAVRIYRQVAQARPDAFLPRLAASLNNLANRLSALGRREDALVKARETVRIYGQLAQAQPDAFLPDMAQSLNNLANRLSDLGRREKALVKAQETVRIYGQLAQAQPDAFLPDVAMSLNNLANRLSDLGRREEALAKSQEAVRIYGQLAQVRPNVFLPDVAMSLNNLATTLSDLGRREEALAKSREAVRIYGQLAQARPDAFLQGLAMSCGARGTIFREMENQVEAAASFLQGIQVLTPLFQKMPPAFAQLTGSLIQDYIQACEQAKAEPDLALLAPVMEVFEKLKQNQSKE